MTIEQKAKAYDEALEKAKKYMDEGYTVLMPDLFPQLHEREDEQTRKRLIDFISNIKAISESGRNSLAIRKDDAEMCDAFLLYLEKWKEQKPVDFEHEMWKNCEANFEGGKKEVLEHPEKYGLQKEQKPIEDVIKNIIKNKESAIKFLKSAGIMDDNGELAEMYRSEQKPAEWNYDNRIQYDSVKSGIEAFASTYSFNIESKLFPQLTKEQQQLWREEIEQAVIAGGENGVELARDNRYKENANAEWSEEDEVYLQDALWCVNQAAKVARGENDMGACWSAERWLKSLRPVKQEWSEEDKSFYDSIMCEVVKEGMHPTPEQANWFKSLPERFNFQPKQEWSDEDKKDVAHIIRILDDCYAYGRHDLSKTDHENLVNKLKSLRPQPHWKPSEEQMMALADTLEDMPEHYKPKCTLESLKRDLEKLM